LSNDGTNENAKPIELDIDREVGAKVITASNRHDDDDEERSIVDDDE
jgi:hypothetical protein